MKSEKGGGMSATERETGTAGGDKSMGMGREAGSGTGTDRPARGLRGLTFTRRYSDATVPPFDAIQRPRLLVPQDFARGLPVIDDQQMIEAGSACA